MTVWSHISLCRKSLQSVSLFFSVDIFGSSLTFLSARNLCIIQLKILMLHVGISSISVEEMSDSALLSFIHMLFTQILPRLIYITVFFTCWTSPMCLPISCFILHIFPISYHTFHHVSYLWLFLLAHMVPMTAVHHDLYLSYTLLKFHF